MRTVESQSGCSYSAHSVSDGASQQGSNAESVSRLYMNRDSAQYHESKISLNDRRAKVTHQFLGENKVKGQAFLGDNFDEFAASLRYFDSFIQNLKEEGVLSDSQINFLGVLASNEEKVSELIAMLALRFDFLAYNDKKLEMRNQIALCLILSKNESLVDFLIDKERLRN